MANDNYPKTVTIHGSGGDAEYCAVTGEAVTDPYTNEDFILAKIDLREYLEYWNLLDPDGISLGIDVCDIGGWNGLGVYVGPEFGFRADAIIGRHEELMRACNPDPSKVGKLTLKTTGDVHELILTPGEVELFAVWGEPVTIGRWKRIDHAYETAIELCRSLKCSSFEVKI